MGRGYGVKYQNKDFVYVSLKKHYCPHCKTKVKTVMVEKTVERNSPEAKDFDFRFGIAGTHFIVDKATFKWKEFECPTCNTHFTIKEMQQIEGVYEEPEEKAPESKKRTILKRIFRYIFMIALFILITYLYKKCSGEL